MNKKSKKELVIILCCFFSFLFFTTFLGRWLAINNSSLVSSLLNQRTFEIINLDGTTTDRYTNINEIDYPWYYRTMHNSVSELEKDADALCESVEAEGATLLFNKKGRYDGIEQCALPLNKKHKKVTFFSVGSIRPHFAGQGSHCVSTITSEETYLKAFTEAGYNVNEIMWNRYLDLHGDPSNAKLDTLNKYRRNRAEFAYEYKLGEIPWSDLYLNADQNIRNSVSDYGDAAIFCITRQGGESHDLWAGRYGSQYPGQGNGIDMLKLNSNEISVLEGLTDLKRNGSIQKIIVVLNLSNAIGMDFIRKKTIDIDAVIWTGGYGERGIYAVPKLLDGTMNFSGSLPFTFYYDNWDCPSVANLFNGQEANNTLGSMMNYTNLSDFGKKQDQYTTTYVVYKEGIYVDYRYPETRYEDVVLQRENSGDFDYSNTIAYTHGSSLSYTDFEIILNDVTQIPLSSNYKVNVTVKNIGNVPGKKTVQVYAQKAYSDYDIRRGIEKSSVDFVGFEKTKELKPGESENLLIEVLGRDFLASYDATGVKTYVVSSGTYYLAIGNNAHDALNNILAAKGKTTSDGMDYNGNERLTWSINKLFDSKTFSVSRATGAEITNLFDESDINKYSGRGNNSVKYITRNNWQDTVTFFSIYESNYEKLQATAEIFQSEVLGQEQNPVERTYRQYPEYNRNYKTNPLIGENGEILLKNNLGVVDLFEDEKNAVIPINDMRWDWLLNQLSWDETVRLVSCGQRHTEAVFSIGLPASFNYNESNGIACPSWDCFDTGKKVVSGSIMNKALAVAFNDPDQGTAPVLWPANCVFTATLNRKLAEDAGVIWGEEGNWAGLSGIYGPGFNCYRTPYGGRHYEYFGADPYGAGNIGACVVKGIQSQGLFCVIKHFAFNEQEAVRKAACIWLSEQAAREIYLRMFEYPIVEGGALCVMGSMGRLGATACNANKNLITGWLKEETGLKGFATTDISFSSTKPAMIKAGTDLFDNNSMSGEHSLNDYMKNEESNFGYADFAWRMRDAAKRIAFTVLHSNAINGIAKGSKMKAVLPSWVYVINVICMCLGFLCVISYIALAIVLILDKKIKIIKNGDKNVQNINSRR